MNRPAGIGTIPKLLLYAVDPRPAPGQPHHEMARHGILLTPRVLTCQELRDYELAPLADGEALDSLAGQIAESMRPYAAEYLECFDTDPVQFSRGVFHGLRRIETGETSVTSSPDDAGSGGFRFSIGDGPGLARRVMECLRAMVAQSPVKPGAEADTFPSP